MRAFSNCSPVTICNGTARPQKYTAISVRCLSRIIPSPPTPSPKKSRQLSRKFWARNAATQRCPTRNPSSPAAWIRPICWDTALPYKESFLSGGVDSSYLLAASDAQAANTVGYEESGFDESALARQTAEALNKPINIKMIAPQEYFDRIPTVMEKMGQPLGDASAVAFSLGCAAVREHAEVVYSGEGIDERIFRRLQRAQARAALRLDVSDLLAHHVGGGRQVADEGLFGRRQGG